MDVHLGLPDAAAARRELAALGVMAGAGPGGPAASRPGGGAARRARPAGPARPPGRAGAGPGQALLATWHQLLDAGRMQDGEPYLAGTARPAVRTDVSGDRGGGRNRGRR